MTAERTFSRYVHTPRVFLQIFSSVNKATLQLYCKRADVAGRARNHDIPPSQVSLSGVEALPMQAALLQPTAKPKLPDEELELQTWHGPHRDRGFMHATLKRPTTPHTIHYP